MTLDQILNMDAKEIVALKNNPRELRQLTTRIRDVAQKRLKRAQGAKIKPPAVTQIEKAGGFKRIKNLDTKQVITEFQKIRAFLLNPQSTIPGTKKFIQSVTSKLGISDMTMKQTNDFLRIWSRLKTEHPEAVQGGNRYGALVNFLHDEITDNPNINLDSLFERAEQFLNKTYEEEETTGGGTSGFFEVD